jgi:hypothetical protein
MELQVFWIGQLALTLVITKVVICRLDGKKLKESETKTDYKVKI